ncbi:DNA repair and recombination protein RadB [Candidatus Pacearchaeota archaeon]|nr:DNA repair and recombination protein RadB [Candidatus Pacearchaeota archaeon]
MAKISAGSYELNKWLFGGYETDVITTIYGPAGSGKTNFCLLAAVSQAKKGNKVLYVDTEGGFSTERIKQIAGEFYQQILENILVLKPTKFSEQQEAFQTLLKEIKEKKNIGLIVVDGITMLYRLELAAAARTNEQKKIKEVNSDLANQLRILSEISRKQNIPVIVTNQVYSEFLTREEIEECKERNVCMVGGDILKYWSKCIIEIQNKQGKRKAILRKHRSLPEKELDFIITNRGIEKAGFRIF